MVSQGWKKKLGNVSWTVIQTVIFKSFRALLLHLSRRCKMRVGGVKEKRSYGRSQEVTSLLLLAVTLTRPLQIKMVGKDAGFNDSILPVRTWSSKLLALEMLCSQGSAMWVQETIHTDSATDFNLNKSNLFCNGFTPDVVFRNHSFFLIWPWWLW